MDTARTDASMHEGKVYTFLITDYKEGGRNLVVSRRALLEAEQRARAAEVRQGIVAGAVLTGRVASVRDFGAFIDLGGGVQGLLHVSEMGWSRIQDPSTVLQPGEAITVKVLQADEAKQKISLGLKQLTDDPWSKAQATYEAGQVVTGRVTRLADFGAFVELEPGVEALAHVSTFPPSGRPQGWKASVAPGTTATFEILSVDPDKKRIGVAPVPEGSSRAAGTRPASDIAPGARLRGKVERHEKFGVFVFLAPGRTGLIPLGETGVARDADLGRTFPVGSDIDVVVLEVDETGRRIRLSVKAIEEAQEAAELREYTRREQAAAPEGFGSLGDRLRSALKPEGK
jgi:small subunit ribosomal protein S1